MKPKPVIMKYYMVFYFSFSLLFLANFVSSEDTPKAFYNVTAVYDIPSAQVVFYNVRGELALTCHVNVSDDATDKNDLKIVWYKTRNEKDEPVLESKERERVQKNTDDVENGIYKLVLNKATFEDAGNYTCILVNGEIKVRGRGHIVVASRPVTKCPSHTSVVEGEKLFIHCLVHGKPTYVTWKVGNETYETSGDRVILQDDEENGVPNSILVIEEAELADRNEYLCTARSNYSTNMFAECKTVVRVKDKLAALWPFLGICAEVFVLCAIILIYEKKRNKTELEESDTDQSPDQKNTPDNGKDSDIRHRK